MCIRDRARSVHREQDLKLGIRGKGIQVTMGHVMWARWLEVAHGHVLAAEAEFARIKAGETTRLVNELRASMVAIAAAASTIEALCEDVRYLIPERPKMETAAEGAADLLGRVLGIGGADAEALSPDLERLFEVRNGVVHAYSEMSGVLRHPAGPNTSWEHAVYNAPESRWALDVALRVMAFAEHPPSPANRSVARWVRVRAAYFEQVVSSVRVLGAS